jgi:hypothetical protein
LEAEWLNQFNAAEFAPTLCVWPFPNIPALAYNERVNSSGILPPFWLFGNHVFVEQQLAGT